MWKVPGKTQYLVCCYTVQPVVFVGIFLRSQSTALWLQKFIRSYKHLKPDHENLMFPISSNSNFDLHKNPVSGLYTVV